MAPALAELDVEEIRYHFNASVRQARVGIIQNICVCMQSRDKGGRYHMINDRAITNLLSHSRTHSQTHS